MSNFVLLRMTINKGGNNSNAVEFGTFMNIVQLLCLYSNVYVVRMD